MENKEKETDFLEIYKFLNKQDELPTENKKEYWILAFSKNKYPEHTSFGGKWLLFIDEKEINEKWNIVKKAIKENKLGKIAKVSTKLGKKENNQYVICIYTYDSRDENDMLKIREELSKLGFKNKIPYKRDIETKNRVYGSENEFLLWK